MSTGFLSGYSRNSSHNLNHFLFSFLSGRKGLLSPCFLSNSQSSGYILIAFLMLNIPRLL